MRFTRFSGLLLSSLLALGAGCAADTEGDKLCEGQKCDYGGGASVLDKQLRSVLDAEDVGSLDVGESADANLIALGQALYFDKELSGNRDISCATCHHPLTFTGDELSLPIGTGGTGLGRDRVVGSATELVPRNAPDVFNRRSPSWTTMFWDSRVSVEHGNVASPAGAKLPSLLSTPLEVQAMFPPTSGTEMRGKPGDFDVNGYENELAIIADDDLEGIWAGITARLLAIDEYVALFARAYPGVAEGEIGFEHAARAIAAFEGEAFTFTGAPFDRYLAGDNAAMSDSAKRGAILFYGDANCSQCHSGALLTDQKHHNICAPQIGPGRGDVAPEDIGRFAESKAYEDRYAFRTPALRNVELTGPWMHSGSYTDLEAAIRHHLDPRAAVERYDVEQLAPDLRTTLVSEAEVVERMFETLDPIVRETVKLSDSQVADLMSFMAALTDPAAVDMSSLVPKSVPSGLRVAD